MIRHILSLSPIHNDHRLKKLYFHLLSCCKFFQILRTSASLSFPMICSALYPFFFILTPYTYSQSDSNSSPGPVFGGQVIFSFHIYFSASVGFMNCSSAIDRQKRPQGIKSISPEPLYQHFLETPFHTTLQKVRGWVVKLFSTQINRGICYSFTYQKMPHLSIE
jgi:hypothetical protein